MNKRFNLLRYVEKEVLNTQLVEYEIKDIGINHSVMGRENTFYFRIFDWFINGSCEDI